MTRSYDIADFHVSDGLPPRVVDKLNLNYRRLLGMIVVEDAGSAHSITDADLPLSTANGGTGRQSFPSNSILVGNGNGPVSYLETGSGFLYSAAEGTPAYWREMEAGNSNWFGTGSPTGSRDPSTAWTTVQEKGDHLGDLYWDLQGNLLYYWSRTGSTFSWTPIPISGGGQGTSDYDSLANRPSIESVVLTGDKSFADLGLSPVTATEIWALF